MTIVGTGSLRNRFTIRNLRFLKFNLKFFIIFQTPLQRTQMEFSLSVYQCLLQLFRLLDHPCRIFFTHTIQDGHHLFHVRFVHRFDSTGIFRIRIFDKVEFIIAVFTVECIACLHIFQFYGSTNITRLKFFHFHTVTTGYDINLSDTFFRTTVGIQQVITFTNLAAHYFKVRYFTDMRLDTRLEEVQRFGTVYVRSHFLTICVFHFRHFRHKRNYIAKKFHQTANAHVLTTANTEYREHTSGDQTLTDTFTHFIFCQRILFEEFLHQSFVIFGSGFYQCFMHFHSLIHFFCRYIFNRRSTAFGSPRIFFHQQYVNQGIKARTGSNRILDGNHLRSIRFFQLFEDIIIVAFFIIKLVD